VSKSRAAVIAGLSLWEFGDVVTQRGTRWDYSVEDAKQELHRALAER
jgi:predicted HTH domain antitoxin